MGLEVVERMERSWCRSVDNELSGVDNELKNSLHRHKSGVENDINPERERTNVAIFSLCRRITDLIAIATTFRIPPAPDLTNNPPPRPVPVIGRKTNPNCSKLPVLISIDRHRLSASRHRVIISVQTICKNVTFSAPGPPSGADGT